MSLRNSGKLVNVATIPLFVSAKISLVFLSISYFTTLGTLIDIPAFLYSCSMYFSKVGNIF